METVIYVSDNGQAASTIVHSDGDGNGNDDMEQVGSRTGTGKPMGFPKWVTQAWVQCWVLVHRDTPCTCTVVWRVSTSKLP